MELVPNNKGGHKLLYEDYMYTKKASYKTTVRWECSQKCSKQCNGSLTTDTEMARVIRSSAHSHDGSKVTVATIKVRTTLKDRASTSRGTPAQLRVGQVISCWSTKPFWSGDSPGMDIDQWWQTFSDPWQRCWFLRKDVSLCIGGYIQGVMSAGGYVRRGLCPATRWNTSLSPLTPDSIPNTWDS